MGEALAHFSQRFERISREAVSAATGPGPARGPRAHRGSLQDGEEGGRVGALAQAGACPCWCAHWAEVHVRSPTGDVAWAMRMQNNMSFDYLLESPLQDVAVLLAAPPPAPSPAPEARFDEPRERSGSASAPAAGRAADLYKSRCVPAAPARPRRRRPR